MRRDHIHWEPTMPDLNDLPEPCLTLGDARTERDRIIEHLGLPTPAGGQPTPPRRAIVVSLGDDILARMLRLPPDWKITSVQPNWRADTIELMVTGPTAPIVAEGAEPMLVFCGIEVGATPDDPQEPVTVTVILPTWAELEAP